MVKSKWFINILFILLLLYRHITGKDFKANYNSNELSEENISPKMSRVSCYLLYDVKTVSWVQKRVMKQMRTSFQKGLQRASRDLQAITSSVSVILSEIMRKNRVGNKCGKSCLVVLLGCWKSSQQTQMRATGWQTIEFAGKWWLITE